MAGIRRVASCCASILESGIAVLSFALGLLDMQASDALSAGLGEDWCSGLWRPPTHTVIHGSTFLVTYPGPPCMQTHVANADL